MSRPICVYNDVGCVGVDPMKNLIRRHFPEKHIEEVSASDILNKKALLKCNPSRFFMGGGESRYLNIHLGKRGRDNILDYIHRGGLGFFACSASYYASENLQYIERFKRFTQIIKLGKKHGQLGLFSGTARGEACDFKGNGDFKNLAKVAFANSVARIYYYKGPYFVGLGEDDEVLARFSGITTHPAVVKSRYGQGLAILTSVHPEYDEKSLAKVGLKTTQKEIDLFSKHLFSHLNNI
jgi:glutamine amidotransferase-like uncharacterized protein